MKLEHFFRLIVMSIFQSSVTAGKVGFNGEPMSYNSQYFYCPQIVCKDGFSISLQINNGNYCSSENGYRELGVDWKEVEFGFPTENEKDMWKYSEMYGYVSYDDEGNEMPFDESKFDITNSVGRIPIDVMQKVCDKHGGIDWDKTLSKEKASQFIKL